jgi:probable rRNA maturation factor
MSSDGSHPGTRLRVSVVDASGRPLRLAALAGWLARTAPRRVRGAVTIALVSDRRVRSLNRQYRGIDRPTDVLSFPSFARDDTRSVPTGALRAKMGWSNNGVPFLGDVVIARGVAARQARAAGHDERTEWRVLALHGLLHLLGYDHDRDRGEMRRVETRLRRRGGLDAGLIERRGDR